MVFELGAIGIWTIAKFIIKSTKKFSKEFIQDKFKLSDVQIELIYEAVDNPEKIGDFISTLIGKEEKIKEVETSFMEIKNEETLSKVESLRNDPLEIVFNKLEIYSDFLQEIYYIQSIRKEPIVLEGFFNNEFVVSVFDYSAYSDFKVHTRNDHISCSIHQNIYVEPFESLDSRTSRVEELRNEFKYAKNKQIAYSKLGSGNFKIENIFENYIETNDISNLQNEQTLKPFFNIQSDYKGIVAMKESLKKYIKLVIEDIENIKKLREI